jgi:SAM-dependent methyltransferase
VDRRDGVAANRSALTPAHVSPTTRSSRRQREAAGRLDFGGRREVCQTVDDPRLVLGEVRRVLKPGGRFMFLEHVAPPSGKWRRGLQNVLHRPWCYCFEGCNTNRETASVIRSAGFERVDIEEYKMTGPFVPVSTQIAGTAIA